jgi:hypothetical protein
MREVSERIAAIAANYYSPQIFHLMQAWRVRYGLRKSGFSVNVKLIISRFRVLGLLGTYTFLLHPSSVFWVHFSLLHLMHFTAVIALPFSCQCKLRPLFEVRVMWSRWYELSNFTSYRFSAPRNTTRIIPCQWRCETSKMA